MTTEEFDHNADMDRLMDRETARIEEERRDQYSHIETFPGQRGFPPRLPCGCPLDGQCDGYHSIQDYY